MSVVYFVRAGLDGPIKVGFTNDAPEVRMRYLQVGCPWPLSLIGAREGSIFHEQLLHNKFSALRMVGEWFEPTDDLLAEITKILSPDYVWPDPPHHPVESGISTGKFLAEIEAFLCDTGISATAFGIKALNDPKFVHDLRKAGRQPGLRLVDRAYLFMRDFHAESAA